MSYFRTQLHEQGYPTKYDVLHGVREGVGDACCASCAAGKTCEGSCGSHASEGVGADILDIIKDGVATGCVSNPGEPPAGAGHPYRGEELYDAPSQHDPKPMPMPPEGGNWYVANVSPSDALAIFNGLRVRPVSGQPFVGYTVSAGSTWQQASDGTTWWGLLTHPSGHVTIFFYSYLRPQAVSPNGQRDGLGGDGPVSVDGDDGNKDCGCGARTKQDVGWAERMPAHGQPVVPEEPMPTTGLSVSEGNKSPMPAYGTASYRPIWSTTAQPHPSAPAPTPQSPGPTQAPSVPAPGPTVAPSGGQGGGNPQGTDQGATGPAMPPPSPTLPVSTLPLYPIYGVRGAPAGMGDLPTLQTALNGLQGQQTGDAAAAFYASKQAADTYKSEGDAGTASDYDSAVDAYKAAGQAAVSSTGVGGELSAADPTGTVNTYTQQAWAINSSLNSSSVNSTKSTGTAATQSDAQQAQGYVTQMLNFYVKGAQAAIAANQAVPAPTPSPGTSPSPSPAAPSPAPAPAPIVAAPTVTTGSNASTVILVGAGVVAAGIIGYAAYKRWYAPKISASKARTRVPSGRTATARA
jgi:hypothetical protein